MKIPQQTVAIAGVLLVLLFFVAFNFNQITGKITHKPDVTEVVVNPDEFIAGNYVNVEINPSKACARRIIHIFAENGIRKASIETRKGTIKFCKPITVRWKTPSTFQGTYRAAVYDYGIKEYVLTDFKVLFNEDLLK